MSSGIKPDRYSTAINPGIQQSGVRPLLTSPWKRDIDEGPIRRAIFVKANIVVDSANRASNPGLGLNLLVEHMKYRAEFAGKVLYRSKHFGMILIAMFIKPSLVVVIGEAGQEAEQPR